MKALNIQVRDLHASNPDDYLPGAHDVVVLCDTSTSASPQFLRRPDMKIGDQLREAAALIEAGREPFICHALARNLRSPVWGSGGLPASVFLASLGMPLDGGGFTRYSAEEEGSKIPSETRQELRVAWCYFAADLADEWGVE